MSKSLSPFQPLADVGGVFVAGAGSLRCTAFLLRDGGLCLYSPVAGLTTAARDSLHKLGNLAYLLAPNHYHNKGLREYATAFPEAKCVCSRAAEPRLTKQTGLAFDELEALVDALPSDAQVLAPEGLKTGEVWLEIPLGNDTVWLVTDAFNAPSKPLGTIVDTPTMLGTFPKYGVRDAAVYRAWVIDQITKRSPTILVPCHGSPVRRRDLGTTLTALLKQYL